jgi:superfamily II DNA or RNA helicase
MDALFESMMFTAPTARAPWQDLGDLDVGGGTQKRNPVSAADFAARLKLMDADDETPGQSKALKRAAPTDGMADFLSLHQPGEGQAAGHQAHAAVAEAPHKRSKPAEVKHITSAMPDFMKTQTALVRAAGSRPASGRAASRAAGADDAPAAATPPPPPEPPRPPMHLPLPVDAAGLTLPCQPGSEALDVPGDLADALLPFQKEGVAFIHSRYCLYTGCVLADDMGLGKTIQTIAFLSALLKKRGKRQDNSLERHTKHRILIVTPVSLVKNWVNELERWGTFSHVTARGGSRVAALSAAAGLAAEVCLTTPGTYRDHADEFNAVPWAVIVCDEAHTNGLQNAGSKGYEAFCKAPPCAFKLFLTATPGSNDLMQLHALFSLLVPDCLGSQDHFRKHYSVAINRGRDARATPAQMATGDSRAAELKVTLERYMLIRKKEAAPIRAQLKEAGMQLMCKKEQVVFCELAPLQMAALKRMLNSEDFQLLSRYYDPCDLCPGEHRGKCCYTTCDGPFFNTRDHSQCEAHGRCPTCMIFPFMQLVQDVANHLELIKVDRHEPDSEEKTRRLQMARAILGPDVQMAGGLVKSESWEHLADVAHCGKLRTLEALLQRWSDAPGEKNKVLIFSKRVQLLYILEKFLQARKHSFVMLDGSVPAAERSRLVDEFNSRPSTFVFLLSVMAGGTGLNLTAANRVVIFDPHWNPAVDVQAQDRAFRIGNSQDVTVYRFLGANTIEELMYMRQIAKSHVTSAAIAGADNPRLFNGALGGDEDTELWGITNLFKPLPEDESIRMRSILERAETIGGCGARLVDIDIPTPDGDPIEDDDDDAGDVAGAARGGARFDDMATLAPDERELLQAGGATYVYDHRKVMDKAPPGPAQRPGLSAPGAAAMARAAAAMRAPAAQPPAAPSGAPGSMLGPLAAHMGMSEVQCAQRLLELDSMQRDNIVEAFLAAKGRHRSHM